MPQHSRRIVLTTKQTDALLPFHETLADDIDWIANSGDVQTKTIDGEWRCGTKSYELQNVCRAARAYLRTTPTVTADEARALEGQIMVLRGLSGHADFPNFSRLCDFASRCISQFIPEGDE